MLPPNQTWCEVIDINERNSALISCFQPIAPGVREGRVVATFSYQLEGHDRPVEWYVSEPTRRFVGFDQNDSGCVLGWDAPSLGYTNARPVLHCGTFLFYIDSMLPPEWTLVSVGSVNNRGAMAATVRNNLGLDMAAVLTPRCD